MSLSPAHIAHPMVQKHPLTRPIVVIVLVLVCSLLWGSAFPVLKVGFNLLEIAGDTAGKLYFAGYRFLLAGLMLFAGRLLMQKPVILEHKGDYAILALIGALQTTLQYMLFYVGLSNTTGMKASIIVGSGSIFLALFSHLWMADDAMSKEKIFGLILGFTGIVIVNIHTEELNLDFKFTGEGFLLLGVLCSTVATLLVKKTAVRIDPPLMVAYQLSIGAVFLLALATGMAPPGVFPFTGPALLILGYLSVVSAAAFSLWYILVKYNQLTKMAVYRFLIPVCGTFLSAAILDSESLNGLTLLSLALVSVGILLTSRTQAGEE